MAKQKTLVREENRELGRRVHQRERVERYVGPSPRRTKVNVTVPPGEGGGLFQRLRRRSR